MCYCGRVIIFLALVQHKDTEKNVTAQDKHRLIHQLWNTTDMSAANIAALLGMHQKNVYYHINYCKCAVWKRDTTKRTA